MDSDSEVAARLARRYPTRRRRWLDWRLLAVVFGLVGLAWVLWAATDGAVPAVSARIDAFQVRSDTDTDIDLTIQRKDASRAAQCLVFVQAVSYERVGELVVQIPAGGDALTHHQVSVRTFKRGTSADLESCRPVG